MQAGGELALEHGLHAAAEDADRRLVQAALSLRRVGSYQLQAAIAAVHAEARHADETDWRQIVALYGELMRVTSSPVVALNYAAAVAMSEGPERGLDLLEEAGAGGALENYYLFHASRADLLRRLGRVTEAARSYSTALSLTTNQVEMNYIQRRLNELDRRRKDDNFEQP